ncbi:Ferredoxin-NADP reductase [Thermosyntropha lipolytica DSM 11003]|uniref:Ferredoxin-NADP reductase n=1 Tax=Thermosyntropha lipolytica DSM 11003 TaxID=1123382 RepID=A0A1M5LC35_9FIRM|nr:4Fe-4S binding protein [Thermosyntropha lipolytica]SHG62567.1 Ferredoxin-NADP reductase [Thermosyntropha lipolytica DSM 11003]
MEFYIKTNRIFTPLRQYVWLFIFLVAVGGLWYPKLGLLMIPIMLTLMILGMLKGKYWCGNICPHGSFFDGIIMPVSRNISLPAWLKHKVTIFLMFAWFMYMLGSRLAKVISLWGTTPFIDKLGYIFVTNYLVVTILGTILALTIAPRAWCRICPMGTMQILFYKLGNLLKINHKTDAKVTIANKDMCHICGKCARVCPMQLTPYLEFNDDNQLDNNHCIKCQTCVKNCPAGILSLKPREEALFIKETMTAKINTKPAEITAQITDIKELNKDTREYTFKLLNPTTISFQAGQFILVKIQDYPVMYRAYSISYYHKGILKIIVKKVPKGYGTGIIFNKFQVGDKVLLRGPMGEAMVLKNPAAQKLLFVAGGIGITPFLAMVEEALAKGADHIKLIHGVRNKNELIYKSYFDELTRNYAHFEYIPVVSDDDKEWKGKKGLVTDIMRELDLNEYKIYMCGSPAMIEAGLNLLSEAGIEKENIYYETA